MDTQDGNEAMMEIRVKGHLDRCWSEWFDDLAITNLEGGDCLLSGFIADQAALHGLLRKIRDRGLPLLSVARIDSDPQTGDEEGSERGFRCSAQDRERRDQMFARVLVFNSPLEKLDDGSRYFEEQAIPAVEHRPGFVGAYWMVDRQSGRVIGMTLWESAEELHATEQQHQSPEVRARRDEATGATNPDAAIMEVTAHC